MTFSSWNHLKLNLKFVLAFSVRFICFLAALSVNFIFEWNNWPFPNIQKQLKTMRCAIFLMSQLSPAISLLSTVDLGPPDRIKIGSVHEDVPFSFDLSMNRILSVSHNIAVKLFFICFVLFFIFSVTLFLHSQIYPKPILWNTFVGPPGPEWKGQ